MTRVRERFVEPSSPVVVFLDVFDAQGGSLVVKGYMEPPRVKGRRESSSRELERV